MAEFWMWWLQAISFHCFNMLCYISASYNCSNADLHHIPRYSEQCQVSLQLHGSRYGLPVRTDRTTDHIWPKRVGFRLCEFAVAVYHLIPNPSQMPMSAKAPEGRKEGWSPTSAWFWRHVKWASEADSLFELRCDYWANMGFTRAQCNVTSRLIRS